MLQAQHSDVDAVADILLDTSVPDIHEPEDSRDAFAELVQMAVEADPSLAERAKSHYSASTSLLGGFPEGWEPCKHGTRFAWCMQPRQHLRLQQCVQQAAMQG